MLVESLQLWVNQEDCAIVVGGDVNARIGASNQLDNEMIGTPYLNGYRMSLDPIVNKNGAALVDSLEELGLTVLNGRSHSDFIGGETFVSSLGASVINHIWVNGKGVELVTDFYIANIGMLDHWPVAATLECEWSNRNLIARAPNTGHRILKWKMNNEAVYQNELDKIQPCYDLDVDGMLECL